MDGKRHGAIYRGFRLEFPILLNPKFKTFPQVTRLLEIAAAMSSAQEKVTGSGKLDLSGVMAALAMANKQEGGSMVDMTNKQEGGRTGFAKQPEKERQSFLHGGWRPEEGKPENRRLNSSSEIIK